jgi:hypothetical protein
MEMNLLSQKWEWRLFWDCSTWLFTNSFLIYRFFHPDVTHTNFCQMLTDEMFVTALKAKWAAEGAQGSAPSAQKKRASPRVRHAHTPAPHSAARSPGSGRSPSKNKHRLVKFEEATGGGPATCVKLRVALHKEQRGSKTKVVDSERNTNALSTGAENVRWPFA